MRGCISLRGLGPPGIQDIRANGVSLFPVFPCYLVGSVEPNSISARSNLQREEWGSREGNWDV